MNKIQKNTIIKFILLILILFQFIYISNKRLIFKREILYNSLVKDFGSQYVMTPDLLELKEITNNLKLKEINISEKLKNNVYFLQRSVEFLYPIKINNKTKIIFYSSDEEIPNNCKIINDSKYFKMTKC